MAEQLIPGAPRWDVVLNYGADLLLHISRTADGVPAPFELGLRAFIRLGGHVEEGVYDCDIVDGEIIMRVESEVLDEFKRGTSYVLLTSIPTDPTTEVAHLAGKLIREG